MSDIQVKDVPAVTVMSLSFTGSYDQTQRKLDHLMSWLLRVGHPYSGTPLALYYDDPAKVAAAKLRADVCLPLEEQCEAGEDVERKALPAATVACAVHVGPYAGISEVYEQIFDWIGKNGYRFVPAQPTREVFVRTAGQARNPAEYVTEVQVPVEKA